MYAQRLEERRVIDVKNGTATVSAGYRLSDLDQAAAEHGLFLPIDLGADPKIGGMVATNPGARGSFAMAELVRTCST